MTFSIFYNVTPITYLKFTPQLALLLSNHLFFFFLLRHAEILRGVFSYYVYKNKWKIRRLLLQYSTYHAGKLCPIASLYCQLCICTYLLSHHFGARIIFYSLIAGHLFKWASISEVDFLDIIGSTRVLVMGQEEKDESCSKILQSKSKSRDGRWILTDRWCWVKINTNNYQ